MQKLQDMKTMSHQITVTLGRNDQRLTAFLLKQEKLSRSEDLVGTHLRNQLYELISLSEQVTLKDSLLKACINRMTPSQTSGILDEMPELREREFPDEWSSSEILWSYTGE